MWTTAVWARLRWLAARAPVWGGAIVCAACLVQAPSARAADAECRIPNAPGAPVVKVSQSAGRALIQVERPNTAGRTLEVNYNDETFFRRFDAEGRAELAFALLAPDNEITIRTSEFPAITCAIKVPEFARIYRAILLWRDPVQLALHVVEPGRKLGTLGHVSPERPNTDQTQGIGRIDVATDVPRDGSTGQISYVIANPAAIPPGRFFSFRLEYVTRGETPAPPYCGEHPLASVAVQLIIIDAGQVSQRRYGTARVPCGEALADGVRYQPLRQ